MKTYQIRIAMLIIVAMIDGSLTVSCTNDRPTELASREKTCSRSERGDASNNMVKAPPELFLDLDNPPVRCHNFVTWSEYDGTPGEGENAVYIWNGAALGRGRLGFERVIVQLDQLPPDTCVLIYPEYNMSWEMDSSLAPRCYPWQNYSSLLDEIRLKRRLRFVYSPYDHDGAVHPQSRDPNSSSGGKHEKRE